MSWIKKGRLLEIDGDSDWMHSHAQLPIYYSLDETHARVYFNVRDKEGRSRPTYAVFDKRTWEKVGINSEKPLLELGEPGSFDDSGIMCSSLVRSGDDLFMYYIGWNRRVSVPYHVSIGLATSKDNGKSFEKYSTGPLLDRSPEEPFFNTSPFVTIDRGVWEMWYASCTGWVKDDKMEPVYNIQYASSMDGVHWKKDKSKPAIDYKTSGEALGSPCVIKENGIYKMYYSYRNILDYRNNKDNSYKLGYAESIDGNCWERKDEMTGIILSKEGWDSQMICYSYVFKVDGKKWMLYNGNGFGKSGFGIAEWNE